MFCIMNYQNGEYSVTTNPNAVDIDAVHLLLSQTYWAKNRPLSTIAKSVENALCFSLFHGDKQIGLIRVITDGAVFAYLCDVVIAEAYRGKGLGKWMLDCVLKHPELQGVPYWHLITADAQEFYRQIGFDTIKDPHKHMEISIKNT